MNEFPAVASWRHRGARTGFEVAFFGEDERGLLARGTTTATENGASWIVDYVVLLDASWTTRSARITGRGAHGVRVVELEADGRGRWTVDGTPAPHLNGCLDLDLESSAMTNTFPVHRLRPLGDSPVAVPAAYVRAADLTVTRLEQTYCRIGARHIAYTAPDLDFACRLTYDADGLISDYPGIAARVQ